MKQLALMIRHEVSSSYRISRDIHTVLLLTWLLDNIIVHYDKLIVLEPHTSVVCNCLSIVRNREQEWAGMK